jgi:hypothetical protein
MVLQKIELTFADETQPAGPREFIHLKSLTTMKIPFFVKGSKLTMDIDHVYVHHSPLPLCICAFFPFYFLPMHMILRDVVCKNDRSINLFIETNKKTSAVTAKQRAQSLSPLKSRSKTRKRDGASVQFSDAAKKKRFQKDLDFRDADRE